MGTAWDREISRVQATTMSTAVRRQDQRAGGREEGLHPQCISFIEGAYLCIYLVDHLGNRKLIRKIPLLHGEEAAGLSDFEKIRLALLRNH